MRLTQIRLKHLLDRLFASLLIVLLSPVLLLIATAILIDDGRPVLFKHLRPGQDGQPFVLLKFRSMVRDADRFLDEQGQPLQDRRTRVGRALRRLSLDELPQLFNILKGEMSFIGPRPALMEHLQRYDNEQRHRLRMRPGITGLAQVNGRNSLSWTERIRLDNAYIEGYSLALDLRILARTVLVVLTGAGQAVDRNPGEVDDLPQRRPN